MIELNQLKFAIPLRSNINHKHSVVLDRKNNKRRGLDFTKALLITDESTQIQDRKLEKEQWNALISKKKMVIKKFDKYIATYIQAHTKGMQKTLVSGGYKYSTLVNYHEELGLHENSPEQKKPL